jgi:hypothetical protein
MSDVSDKTVANTCYDHNRGCFWTLNADSYIRLVKDDLRNRLWCEGADKTSRIKGGFSEIDLAIDTIQKLKTVDYAGPLAGYKQGFYTYRGTKFLVTTSPIIIPPTPGDCSMILGMLRQLLGEEQLPYFFGWLKTGYESVASYKIRPGQALVLAGGRDNGKTLVQSLIITPILGGRTAKPWAYLIGRTNFNSEMFGAEVQVVDDESASTDIASRRQYAEGIKGLTVDSEQKCHKKYCDGVILKPFWRLVILCNDEPQSITVLPPIDDHIADKLMLLKTNAIKLPMPNFTSSEREAFETRIRAELPSFIDFLTRFEIPPALRSERFGIKHYHNQAVLDALSVLAPEEKLLNMIDEGLFETTDDEIVDTAIGIESRIANWNPDQARKIFSWLAASGTYLAKLAKKYPNRFSSTVVDGKTRWHIKPPTKSSRQDEGDPHSHEDAARICEEETDPIGANHDDLF